MSSIKQLYDDCSEIIGNGANSWWGKASRYIKKGLVSSAIVAGSIVAPSDVAAMNNHIGVALLDDKVNSQLYDIQYNSNSLIKPTINNLLLSTDTSSKYYDILTQCDIVENNPTLTGCKAFYDSKNNTIGLTKSAVEVLMLLDVLDNNKIRKHKKEEIVKTIRDNYFPDATLKEAHNLALEVKSSLWVSSVHELSHAEDELNLNTNNLSKKSMFLFLMSTEVKARIVEGVTAFELGKDTWNCIKEYIPETNILVEEYAQKNNFKVGDKIPKEHEFKVKEMFLKSFFNDNLNGYVRARLAGHITDEFFEKNKEKFSKKTTRSDNYKKMYMETVNRFLSSNTGEELSVKDIWNKIGIGEFYKTKYEYETLPSEKNEYAKILLEKDNNVIPSMESEKDRLSSKSSDISIKNTVNKVSR